MSLEAHIKELTDSIKLLTEAIHAGRAAAVAKQATAPASGAALPPKQAAEAEQRKKPVPEATPAVKAPTEGVAAVEPVTYDNVKAAVNGLAKAKGRDAVIAALGEFGLKNATEAKHEQWPEIVKKFTELAAVPA